MRVHHNPSPNFQVKTAQIHQNDCFDSASLYLQSHGSLLAGLCILFGIVIIVAASLSICLYFLVD